MKQEGVRELLNGLRTLRFGKRRGSLQKKYILLRIARDLTGILILEIRFAELLSRSCLISQKVTAGTAAGIF